MKFQHNPPKKILIVNIFGIGDVLFSTPIISNLRLKFPKAGIGYLCNRRVEEVLKKNPEVDKVFVYERDEFNRIYKQSRMQFLVKMLGFLKEIKKERYDLVIDISLNGFISFYCWLAGIKKRIGLNYKNRSRFLTKKIELRGFEDKHVVEYYLDLLKILDCETPKRELKIAIDGSDSLWADNFFKEHNLRANEKNIALVPGGGASWGKDAFYRHWQPENYAKLADKLIEKFSARIILIGDKNECELCGRVAENMKNPCLVCCGRTTISQFAAVLRKSSLVVMNDGGPLHIAVAAGAKTVSIFGPVDEHVYGPYPPGKNHLVVKKDLACRPCYKRFRKASCDHISCLTNITINDVLEKVEIIL